MIGGRHGTNAMYTRGKCRCVECVAARATYMGNWRARNRARELAYQAKRRANRDAVSEAVRRRELYYGMSDDEFQSLCESQDFKCAICLTSFDERKPNVDHDHKCCPGKRSCGKCVRGLLCHFCNTAIGKLNDDPALLQRALNYVTAAEITTLSNYFTNRGF